MYCETSWNECHPRVPKVRALNYYFSSVIIFPIGITRSSEPIYICWVTDQWWQNVLQSGSYNSQRASSTLTRPSPIYPSPFCWLQVPLDNTWHQWVILRHIPSIHGEILLPHIPLLWKRHFQLQATESHVSHGKYLFGQHIPLTAHHLVTSQLPVRWWKLWKLQINSLLKFLEVWLLSCHK